MYILYLLLIFLISMELILSCFIICHIIDTYNFIKSSYKISGQPFQMDAGARCSVDCMNIWGASYHLVLALGNIQLGHFRSCCAIFKHIQN